MKAEFIIIITGIMFLLANASSKEERHKDLRFNQSARLSRKEKADLDFELSLRLLERSRLSDIVNKLQDAGVTVTGFYHTSTWQKHWKSVITGGCCEKGSKTPVTDWREEMNAFNIEFPSTCLRALYAGYKTCGVEYQDAHYSGNFWWADCNHVAALPGLWDPIDNAYACEYFAFNVSAHNHIRVEYAQACGYNMFHCHVNHYDTLCPREKYLPRILQLVSSDPLPSSQTSDKGVQWVSSNCKKAHEKPYIEATSSWAGGNMWWKT